MDVSIVVVASSSFGAVDLGPTVLASTSHHHKKCAREKTDMMRGRKMVYTTYTTFNYYNHPMNEFPWSSNFHILVERATSSKRGNVSPVRLNSDCFGSMAMKLMIFCTLLQIHHSFAHGWLSTFGQLPRWPTKSSAWWTLGKNKVDENCDLGCECKYLHSIVGGWWQCIDNVLYWPQLIVFTSQPHRKLIQSRSRTANGPASKPPPDYKAISS